MRVHFWGTRGSLPIAMDANDVRAKVKAAVELAQGKVLTDGFELENFVESLPFAVRGTYGGHSSCVEIDVGSPTTFICDLGSGIRPLGRKLVESGSASGNTFNIFVSHVHWDHICGFPFFVPAYIPGNIVRIHGCHAELEAAFRRQQDAPSFPVRLDVMAADIEFVTLETDRWYDIDGVSVKASLQHHSGDSYGYRFEHADKSVIYSTDAEHKLESEDDTRTFVDFIEGADLVIFDAMYSLADAISVKEDWGHSSNIVGVDLCQRAHVHRYCMFHHEPVYDDETIESVVSETRRYEELMRESTPLEVMAAYDGLELDL